MRITKAMTNGGIITVSPVRNGNGSYTCEVLLSKLDTADNGSNFRTFKKSHANKIKASFNRQAVRNPILLWNGAMLRSIDGRHTIDCLREQGFKTWTAEVHFGITNESAAAIFYELTQNNKRMGPWDAYAAALKGEYKFALDIAAELEAFGYTTPNHEGYNSKRADFDGFTPLMDSWQLGLPFLKLFLTVLKTWKQDGRKLQEPARKNTFQRGLMDFLEQYRNVYTARQLSNMLMRRSAAEITARAADEGGERVERNHFKSAFESVLELSARIAA